MIELVLGPLLASSAPQSTMKSVRHNIIGGKYLAKATSSPSRRQYKISSNQLLNVTNITLSSPLLEDPPDDFDSLA